MFFVFSVPKIWKSFENRNSKSFTSPNFLHKVYNKVYPKFLYKALNNTQHGLNFKIFKKWNSNNTTINRIHNTIKFKLSYPNTFNIQLQIIWILYVLIERFVTTYS